MNNISESSRLSQDLLTLERDFQYNLTLLNVRDSEIRRCNLANKNLHDIVRCKLSEIEGFTGRLSNLENALEKSKQECESEKLIRHQIVGKLTENLKNITLKLQSRIEQDTLQSKEKQVELEQFYCNLVEQKEEEWRRKLAAIEDRLKKENICTSKATNRLEILIDENMSLRNKISQSESLYTSETYFYKNEFKTLQISNSNLLSEMECMKERCEALDQSSLALQVENDDYKKESCTNREKISNLIKQNKEIVEDYNEFARQIQENEHLRKELTMDNEVLAFQKKQLELECSELKETVEEYANTSYCNNSAHANCDFVFKQNRMLQELVKAMRNERENYIVRNGEAERRLEKLEMLMNILKQRTIDNYV